MLLIRGVYLFSCKWSRGESNSNHQTTQLSVQTSLYSSLRRFFLRVPLGEKNNTIYLINSFLTYYYVMNLIIRVWIFVKKINFWTFNPLFVGSSRCVWFMLESVLACSKIEEVEWGSVWPHPSSIVTLIMSPNPEHTDVWMWFRL